MSEINEKQAHELFLHGLKKSRAAAKQLFELEKKAGWDMVVKGLDTLIANGTNLFTSRPQTRAQTLILSDQITDSMDTQKTVH